MGMLGNREYEKNGIFFDIGEVVVVWVRKNDRVFCAVAVVVPVGVILSG